MVALVAGLAVIASIYFVSAASARHFHEQQRVAQTQMSIRMAMEQLRRDIQRAGFLGTPNSERETRCVTPPEELQAIHILNDEDTAALPQAATNGATADRLRLTGNYVTSDAYLATGLANGAGSAITLQRNWQGFRRDFGVWGSTFDADVFEEVFRPGRYLHIQTIQGMHFFVEITGVDAASATINFTPSLGVGGNCVVGLADGATVAPISRVEYAVTDITATADGSELRPVGGRVTSADDDYRGQVANQLVRREVGFDAAAAPDDATTRVVLEYVAFVDYGLIVDQQTTPGAAPNLQEVRGAAAETLTANDPSLAHRVRSVLVSLAARTAEQDPRFPWVDAAAGDPATGTPPTRYRVVSTDSEFQGAARVRSLRSEIFVPNVANRVMRP
jgi:type II secretory pathway component PulJ